MLLLAVPPFWSWWLPWCHEEGFSASHVELGQTTGCPTLAVSVLLGPRDKKKPQVCLSPSLWSQIPGSTLISQDGNSRIWGSSHILLGRGTSGCSHLTLLGSPSSQNDPKAFWGVNKNQSCLGRRMGWDQGSEGHSRAIWDGKGRQDV